MGRRKRHLSDDDDSDSVSSSDIGDVDEDPDTREERALFEDPYQRKRRRRNGKNEALYGVFAEDMEDVEEEKRWRKRSDWAKAPAFVSSDKKVDLAEEIQVDAGSSEGEAEGQSVQQDDSEPSRPPSPRILEEEDDDDDEPPPQLGARCRQRVFRLLSLQ